MTDLHDDDYVCGFSAPLDVKFSEAASSGEFEGIAAAFDNLDSHGDIIRRGAFAGALAEHMSAGTMPALLWAHNQSRPVGAVKSLRESETGLQVSGKLNLGTAAGREAYAHIREGSSRGLSIGYQVQPGGAQRGHGGARVLTKLSLHEISLTPLPSNNRAQITGVKSLESVADLERLLRKAGLPHRAAEKIAGAGFAALSGKSLPAFTPPMLACADDLEQVLYDSGFTREAAHKVAVPGFLALTGKSQSPDLESVAAILRQQSVELKSWSR